jgi:hypothetical protein
MTVINEPPGSSMAITEDLEPGWKGARRIDGLAIDFFRAGRAVSGRLAITSKAPRSISIGVSAISCSLADGATLVWSLNRGLW